MDVQFVRTRVPGAFKFQAELVKAAPALSIQSFIDSGGGPTIPPGNFIANPGLDSPAQLETDLNKLPQVLGSLVLRYLLRIST